MKQKPKYKQPAVRVRWCVLENVIAGSKDPYNSAEVTTEDFSMDDEIEF